MSDQITLTVNYGGESYPLQASTKENITSIKQRFADEHGTNMNVQGGTLKMMGGGKTWTDEGKTLADMQVTGDFTVSLVAEVVGGF